MLQYSLSSPLKRPPPLVPAGASHRWISTALHRRPLLVAASLLTSHGGGAAAGIRADVCGRALHPLRPPLFTATSSPGSPSSCSGSNVGLRSPGPELGLLSLVIVLSMITMSFFTVALVSLPAMGVLKKLSAAVEKLSNVVSREVPGTLLSMKLSVREINEVTQQLSSLRRIISGNRGLGKEDRMNRRSRRCGDDPLVI